MEETGGGQRGYHEPESYCLNGLDKQAPNSKAGCPHSPQAPRSVRSERSGPVSLQSKSLASRESHFSSEQSTSTMDMREMRFIVVLKLENKYFQMKIRTSPPSSPPR